MKTYIALLRGVNVGGKNSLPMKTLVALLEDLGSRGVKTYIQSGNAAFRHNTTSPARLAGKLSAAINESRGFEPRVLLLELGEVAKAIASNPFPEAESQPNRLHLYFLESVPKKPDLEKLEGVKRPDERFRLKGKVFYLHAPEGIGRSELAARAEKSLGVAATVRNWRTVSKIVAMAKEC